MLFYFIFYLLDIKFETFINLCWTLNLNICKPYMKKNSNKFLFWQSKNVRELFTFNDGPQSNQVV
jgi:hypothetical protein